MNNNVKIAKELVRLAKSLIAFIDARIQRQRLGEECYRLGFEFELVSEDKKTGYSLVKFWKSYGLISCRFYSEYSYHNDKLNRTFWVALGSGEDKFEYSTQDCVSSRDTANGIVRARNEMLADTSIETNKELKNFRDEVAKKGGDVDAQIAAAFKDLKSMKLL